MKKLKTSIKHIAPQGQTVSPTFNTQQIVDKVGSGDCFMAGLIYGMIHKHQPADIISFAAAAALI